MDKIYLKPASATGKVRSADHGGAYLPAAGDWVRPSIYWTRRLRDGDVVDDTAARQKAQKAAAAPAVQKKDT